MDLWDINLINAKYHLSIAERMLNGFYDFREKRFLIGVINELARAASNLIKAYLVYEKVLEKNHQKNLYTFTENVGLKYLDPETVKNIFRALEIEKAQKTSKVEFIRNNELILLINENYKVLTSERLSEFIASIEVGIAKFPSNIKR